jgi:protein involved in polysaccharide export with SLBB domain
MNLLFSLLVVLHAAQQPPMLKLVAGQAQAPPESPRPEVNGNGSGYVIGSQDQLKITVFDEPDLSTTYRVDTDGMITFPLVGRVPARGLTLNEFQDRLIARLAAGYIRNPQVRVR